MSDAKVREPSRQSRLVSPTMVGRTDELAALVTSVASPPAVAVVAGEAGIGKSRLVGELLTHPAVTGSTVLVGRGYRIREPFPLGPVLEAVQSLGSAIGRFGLSPLAGSLRPLLPELAGQLPVAPEPLEDPVAERHRVFRALVEVLQRAGETVLVLEDLHWADEQTREFLGYLLSDPPRGLSLLVAYRTEEADHGVRALTAKLPGRVSHAHLVLAPLDATQTGVLAAAILGQDRVSEELATYLCERSSGLPFVIEELLALLQAKGTLVYRGGSWVRKAIDELEVPAGVRDPVLARFSHLSAEARSVTEAAAVLQLPAPRVVLMATCRAPHAEALRGLEVALESGLLVEDRAQMGFRHVLAAQAVYEMIPGPRREELHARAASALDAVHRAPLGQRAYHLRHAGLLEAWAGTAEEAADQATRLGHDDEAARLLEDVLRHAPLPAHRRGRIATKLGDAAVCALYSSEDVADLLSEVLEQDLPRAVRGELRFQLANLLERFGADFRHQRRLLTAAVDELSDRPELKAHAMVGLGFPIVPGVTLAECRQWLRRALDVVPAVDDPVLQVGLLGKVAMVQVCVGDPQWRSLTNRVIEQTGGAPMQLVEIGAYHSIAMNACYAGQLSTADRLLTTGLAGAVARENKRRELWMRATLALLDYCRGSWDGLTQRADVLIDQLADHPFGRTDAEVAVGCLALARGDLDRAAQALREITRQLSERSALDLLPIPVVGLVRLEIGRGDIDSALGAAHRFLAAMEQVPVQASTARALPAVAEAMAAGGQLGEARTLVTRWAEELRCLDAPLAQATVPHARGCLEVAAAQWGSAARDYVAAAEQYQRLGLPYDAAQAHEQAAVALLRSGSAPAGTEHLRAALATFEHLSATWDRDRASQTARQHGVSVPARHRRGRRGYGSDLSPREREVAALAASGRTNKEIAAELYVSVKTVEQHLSVVMRKLGVTSRWSIGRQLGRGWRGERRGTN